WNCGDVAGVFRYRPNQTGAGAELEQGFTDRNEITGTRGRAKELDVASERARSQFEGLIENQTAGRYHRAVAQIEGMKETYRADKVIAVANQSVINACLHDFVVPL